MATSALALNNPQHTKKIPSQHHRNKTAENQIVDGTHLETPDTTQGRKDSRYKFCQRETPAAGLMWSSNSLEMDEGEEWDSHG
jgi:hypothetical protein